MRRGGIQRCFFCLLAGGLLIWFLADAQQVQQTVFQALTLCARSVIPALFPFFVVSTLLISLGAGQLLAPLLEGLMVPLFRIPGCGASALILGLIGGYPTGAGAAAELVRTGQLSREEGTRLLTFCNNSNPIFLISVLGCGVFGSVRTGLWLWLIHLTAALLTGLCFRNLRHGLESRPQRLRQPVFQAASFPAAFVGAVRSALRGTLSVCGFVLFFYTLAQPLQAAAPMAVGVLEMFSAVPLLPVNGMGFLLAAGLSGWGGLSVLCQTAAVLEGSGLSLRPAVLGKLAHSFLSVLLAALLLPYLSPLCV